MSKPDEYDKYIADWKRKQGIPEHAIDAPNDEATMAAEDAKSKGDDYCVGCGDPFKVCEMRIVTDPHCQDDERPEREDNYIPKQYRMRMCVKCFKENYEDFDDDDSVPAAEKNQGGSR